MKFHAAAKSLAVALCVTGFASVALPAAAQPALVKQVAPEYPRGAERRSIEGQVTLNFDITDDGKVANVEVVDATPAGVFDKAAQKALEQWRFEKGQPGEGFEIAMDFKLT